MKMITKILFARLVALLVLSSGLGFSQIVINEIMSVNKSTIADEDNDFADWIELYNRSDSSQQLSGFGLSDDPTEPLKWVFPDVSMAQGEHVLVFASGKDRREPIYWDTIITRGDVWKYRKGTSQPPSSWKRNGYNDSGWTGGPSGFGYGDGDDATVVQGAVTVYVRKKFQIDNSAAVMRLALHVDYDDAFVAWLNGVEVARANIGAPGQTVRYNSTADGGHEALMIQGLPPQFFDISDHIDLLENGDNVLALEVHNVGSNSSDMTLIPFLSIGWPVDQHNRHTPPDFLSLNSAQLHTNFKLKGGGEFLALVDSSGAVLDSLTTPQLDMDVAYGRLPDGGDAWRMLALPTPGETNIDSIYVGKTAPPIFSQSGGLYETPTTVVLTDTGGGQIYYTLDGSDPDENSPAYAGPISINKTTVLRARCFHSPLQPSRIVTQNYILNEDSPFAVVCLSSDPYNLFDDDYGIFVKGPNADKNYPYFGANFWQDWERPVNVALYEPDGRLGFELDAGMRVFGGWSRGRAQKSVVIYQRSTYDSRQIDYRIFPDKDIDHFESFILRNGGNDWDGTMFRDGFMQTLFKDNMDLEVMAFRPAHVYLNGAYWGILDIREKHNEHFLAANRGLDADRVDLLDLTGQSEAEVLHGTNADYLAFWHFLETHNIAEPENYAVVDSMIDISNFIDYEIAEIYIGNTDWPGNNIKYYKPQTPGGTWRWLIFDTDFGFYLYDASYSHNTLAFATATNGPGWPNPPWSTFILRKLLQNDYFQRLFINRFADHINTTFAPERVRHILDHFEAMFDSEIHRQRQRWHGAAGAYDERLARMRTFADRRPGYVRTHIRKQFNLSGNLRVTLDVEPAGAGKIKMNSKIISDLPWSGIYFENVPVPLQAIPNSGWRFVGWSDSRLGKAQSATLTSRADVHLVARFEAADAKPTDVVINEINYNSGRNFFAKDWLELANTSEASISLAGWQISDGAPDHLLTLPETASIAAHGYVVVARDSSHFLKVYSNAGFVYGNLGFDLSNSGDAVFLLDAAGIVVDSLHFDDAPPWPVDADGEGFTLELKSPLLDNSLAENWSAGAVYGGTPGRSNSVVSRVAAKKETGPPQRFQVLQNYPNPFNSTTTIVYSLPRDAHVRVQVFDVLGRKIYSLVDSKQVAGEHRAVWSADAPSGLYFYRLSADYDGGRFVETKKALLVR